MIYSAPQIVRLIVLGIMMFMGAELITRKTPKELRITPCCRSRRVMGWAMTVIPFWLSIYYFSPLYINDVYWGVVIRLCCGYLTSSLIHIAFLVLIGEPVNLKSFKYLLYLSSFAIFPATLILSSIPLSNTLTIIAWNGVLAAAVVIQLLHFKSKYLHLNQNLDKEYLKEIKVHLKWFKRNKIILAVLYIIIVTTPTVCIAPEWVRIVTISLLLIIFVFIYESYNRFILLLQSKKMTKKTREQQKRHQERLKKEETKPIENLEWNKQLSEQISNWIKNRGYRISGLTIESLADEISSNRTYISAYINDTFNCSFKTWLTKLRIEDAKKILLSKHEYSIGDVAKKVGFSSQTSFTHIFRDSEGLPPAKWRAQHRA